MSKRNGHPFIRKSSGAGTLTEIFGPTFGLQDERISDNNSLVSCVLRSETSGVLMQGHPSRFPEPRIDSEDHRVMLTRSAIFTTTVRGLQIRL